MLLAHPLGRLTDDVPVLHVTQKIDTSTPHDGADAQLDALAPLSLC